MNILFFYKVNKNIKYKLKNEQDIDKFMSRWSFLATTFTQIYKMVIKSLGNHIYTNCQINNKTPNITILKFTYFHNSYQFLEHFTHQTKTLTHKNSMYTSFVYINIVLSTEILQTNITLITHSI